MDLTKLRYGVLKGAAREVHDNDKVKFVYADVNCRLKVHPNFGNEQFFTSCDELIVREEKAVKSVFLCNARGEFNIKRITFCVHQRNNIYWSAVLKILTRLILAKLFFELQTDFVR